MKFRNSILIIAIAATTVACGPSNKNTNEENVATPVANFDISGEVNLESSVIGWKGEMLGMYSHNGTVKLTDATLEMDGKNINGGSFTIDMTSMIPTDNGYNVEEGRTKEKLVGHLSSADFFDVENYPTSTFVIDTYKNNEISGTLTIRGKSDTETIKNVNITRDGNVYKMAGTLVFDRQKYDVSFDHPAQEMVLSDDIEIAIELVVS